MKNYYIILGVEPDSTLKQIKSAYRRQAKDLHPDHYGQDSEPFLDLQEAYAVLSDPQRRQQYDRKSGHASSGTSVPVSSQAEPFTPGDRPVDRGDYSISGSFHTFRPSFDELFDGLWQNFSRMRPRVEQLQPLTVEVRISPEEAARGGRLRLMVSARQRCPHCRVRGGVGSFECWQCRSTGKIQGEYPVSITFPPGIAKNHIAQVPLDRFGIANFYLNVVFRVSQR